MKIIIDAVKNFQLSDYGIRGWGVLAIWIGVVALIILINRMVLRLPVPRRDRVMTRVNWSVNLILIVGIVLAVLHGVLSDDYFAILYIGAMIIAKKVDYWYSLYDKTIDEKIGPY